MMKCTDLIEAQFTPYPGDPRLREGEVHLWKVWLPDVEPLVGYFLSSEERARADRFRFERDRAHFIAARGTLRSLLSSYLGIAADKIAFRFGPHGKPSLKDLPRSLKFNLSHSGDLMLLAVSEGCEVGVDVEQVRDDLDLPGLIEQYFPVEDTNYLEALPLVERTAAFFYLWTRAEACLKAAGTGIVDSLRVRDPERWHVKNLTPAPGYAAAVAVESGSPCDLQCWAWPS